MLADAAVGLAAFVVVIPIALFLGGFSFFEPWLIVTGLLLFSTGFLRGAGPGRAWVKAVGINAGIWCVFICAFGVAELANGILAIAVLFSDTLYSRHRGNIRPPVQNSIAE
ncbi:MAG TPA: hypothetical protein VN610_05860 [Bryobacteraceae bacterium]|nr:hypothetical protein [Bryobacteraceae bacterium]